MIKSIKPNELIMFKLIIQYKNTNKYHKYKTTKAIQWRQYNINNTKKQYNENNKKTKKNALTKTKKNTIETIQ